MTLKYKIKRIMMGASVLLGVGVIAAAVFGCIYGWVMNIILLAHSTLTPVTGMVILRIAGIFLFPIGIIMGYVG
jgi:hypothetical protein